MALYRATTLLVNRIMTGRIPAMAFAATSKNDQLDPSGPGVSGVTGGLAFRDLIDLANRTFNLPPALRPPVESFGADAAGPAQPTVRATLNLADVSMAFGIGLRGGPLHFNRNFELDLPTGDNYATAVERTLVAVGLIASAGSLADANVPAALNTRLAGLPVSGESQPPADVPYHDPSGGGTWPPYDNATPVPYRRAAIKIARFTPAGPIAGTLEGARPGDQVQVQTDTGQTTVSVAASGAWSAALTSSAYAKATLVGGAIGPDRLPISATSYPNV